MSMRQFFDELKKGLKRPAYLLTAEDHYVLKEALLAVKNSIPESEREFTFHAYDLDASDEKIQAEKAADVLNSVPFFGGRLVVAIENSQKFAEDEIDRLAQYLDSPSPSSLLILLNAGTLKKHHKDGLAKAKHIPMDIREQDIPYALQERASQEGLALTPDAMEYLIGTIGPDIGLLTSEIGKLALLGKRLLDRDDIALAIKGTGGHDAFDLVNALKAGDADRVFEVYRKMSETTEPYMLLGALNWHYSKSAGGGKKYPEIMALLSEADIMLRRSGGLFPVEYLLFRLLRT